MFRARWIFFLELRANFYISADATSVISMTTPKNKMRIIKRFHFHHTKAIALR